MIENVAALRSRWTPELTETAVRFLRGLPIDHIFPMVEQDGVLYHDLRGLVIEEHQFDEAVIRNVSLRWSTIRDVGWKDARLESCNLSHISFESCYFRRARLQDCNLINAKFTACDFSGSRIEHSRLDFAGFQQCEIRLENLRFRADSNPQVLVRVCRNLKLNAMSMGHFADAGDLTYLEKTFDRHALWRRAFGDPQLSPGHRLKSVAIWLGSMALNGLWGYGERPLRLLAAIAVCILLFGTLQFWVQGLPGRNFWEHVYFSGITFLTIGYGDLAPVGAWSRFLALLEGAAGVSTLGLLIASATKKIMYR